MNIDILTQKVLDRQDITKEEALFLYSQPLDKLCEKADIIRRYFCKNDFDICTIINAKSGSCSEDCKFCAQSVYSHTDIEKYSLLSKKEILEVAKKDYENGALRFSLVTSGRTLSEEEVSKICEIASEIKEKVGISVCISSGLLNKEQFKKLKDAGITRIHNNLETSKNFFPSICTTHTYKEKIDTIKSAQEVGLAVCSGGIMGLGESISDRIDMAFSLKELGIKSVPINILNPIAGTPLEENIPLDEDEVRRVVAIYRFILPDASIRLAGGRGLLADKGKSCFLSGANACISGDMLTTAGISTKTDMELIRSLGYETKLCND